MEYALCYLISMNYHFFTITVCVCVDRGSYIAELKLIIGRKARKYKAAQYDVTSNFLNCRTYLSQNNVADTYLLICFI